MGCIKNYGLGCLRQTVCTALLALSKLPPDDGWEAASFWIYTPWFTMSLTFFLYLIRVRRNDRPSDQGRGPKSRRDRSWRSPSRSHGLSRRPDFTSSVPLVRSLPRGRAAFDSWVVGGQRIPLPALTPSLTVQAIGFTER